MKKTSSQGGLAIPNKLPFIYLAKHKYWRFRHKLTGECALPGNPGEANFHSAYAEKLALLESFQRPKTDDSETFNWLIRCYESSAEFNALADPTQIDYSRTLRLLEKEIGDQPFKLTTRAMIKAVRDDYAMTARKAHKIKQMVSALYSWAEQADLVPASFNPALGIRKLKTKGGTREIVVWSDEEIALFLTFAPLHVRTAVLLAVYTGQRLKDVAMMPWSDFQGDIIRVRQSKTGTLLDIACHPVLRAHLDTLPRQSIQIVTNALGKPMKAHAVAGAIGREVARIDGMPKARSAHGLRYAAAARMEEGGATVAQIVAVLGHRTHAMAIKYATQRQRAKAGVAAMGGSWPPR